MSEFSFRPARPPDRERVLAFCERTWEYGDYIDRVWADWLNDPETELLVAVDSQDTPVGLGHVRLASSDEAWLEGLRVDPEVRQHGLAGVISRAAVETAQRRGATTVRFMTLASNTPVHRLAARLGFERRGTIAFWRAEALTDRPAAFGPGREEPDAVAAFIAGRDSVRALDGLISSHWTFARATGPLLRRWLAEATGQLYRLPAVGPPLAYAWIDRSETATALPVPWVAVDRDHLAEAGLELRRLAPQIGYPSVAWILPEGPGLAEAARAAGFEPHESEPDTGFFLYAYHTARTDRDSLAGGVPGAKLEDD